MQEKRRNMRKNPTMMAARRIHLPYEFQALLQSSS
jgi:hypothetical protein